MKVETITQIRIPVIRDSVFSPELHYGNQAYNEPITGIYFNTEDEMYGRITFEHLDALKLCRGEMFPFHYDWETHQTGSWIFEVQNSKWLMERYNYEKAHYGDSYEGGGNIEEMKTDFKHYLFSFHDEFVEVIAKGFWFEKNNDSLFGKPLQEGHAFEPIMKKSEIPIEAFGLQSIVRFNEKSEAELIENSKFCSQKLMDFILEGSSSVNHTVKLVMNKEKIMVHLRGYFGKKQVSFEHIPTLEEVKPYIEQYMGEVAERRKNMKK